MLFGAFLTTTALRIFRTLAFFYVEYPATNLSLKGKYWGVQLNFCFVKRVLLWRQ
jgi:hypothetical protein